MTRTEAQMTPEERRELNTYRQRLESHASTEAEKMDARLNIDRIEWKGRNGAHLAALQSMEERVKALEAKKGGKPADLKELKADIKALKDTVNQMKGDMVLSLMDDLMPRIRAEVIQQVTEVMGGGTE